MVREITRKYNEYRLGFEFFNINSFPFIFKVKNKRRRNGERRVEYKVQNCLRASCGRILNGYPSRSWKKWQESLSFLTQAEVHSRNGSSETFYYKIRLLQAKPDTTRKEPSAAAQLKEVLAKENVIASKNAQIKCMASDHAASVKRIKILEKQKIAFAKVVNDLEVKHLMERAVDHHQRLNTTSYSGEATDALLFLH